jgi:hypothetical protein
VRIGVACFMFHPTHQMPKPEKTVLVIGASGFLGKAVAHRLGRGWKCMTHVRSSSEIVDGSASSFESEEFRMLLRKSDIVVNCAGVGLTRLLKGDECNASICGRLLCAIEMSHSNCVLVAISSFKANCLSSTCNDPYALDKKRAEDVFRDGNLRSRSVIVRFPAITGTCDRNLQPLLNAMRIIRLPCVSGELPSFQMMSVAKASDIVAQVVQYADKLCGKIVYGVNATESNWNSLVIAAGGGSISIPKPFLIVLTWLLTSWPCSCLIGGSVSVHRLRDLFFHEWTEDSGEGVSRIVINESLRDILSGDHRE